MRDAAAVNFILPLIGFLKSSEKYDIQIVAQEPAARILESQGIDFIAIELAPVLNKGDIRGQELLYRARVVVESVHPDLIVVGHSSLGAGIDEALVKLKVAPSILIQDFWGEINTFFGVLPEYVFTFDCLATTLTQRKHNVACFEIGSLRHQAYTSLKPQKLREQYREELSLNGSPVVGWFGQSLHCYPGYKDTIKAWVGGMRMLEGSGECFVYKPHPLESEQDISATQEILSELGEVTLLTGLSVEAALCVCDSVSSIMSNCLYDAAYINKIAGEPFITPLSMLISNRLYEALSKTIDFSSLPYEVHGLAKVIRELEGLSGELSKAHAYEQKKYCYESSKNNLNDCNNVFRKAESNILNCFLGGK